jgi:hypothetical protein
MGKLTAVLGVICISIFCAYAYIPLNYRMGLEDFQALAWGPAFSLFLPLWLTLIAVSSGLTVGYIFSKGGFAGKPGKH